MRINTNVAGINTLRTMGMNTLSQSKSMEKLSSGLRINRAGDDAAGLAISEKMRAQIRGLNQASRNAQDGISLIQTAEGATNEVHAILQRMRTLTIQSINDTNQDSDRASLNNEVNQLIEEIDRIATTTEFNDRNILTNFGDITNPSLTVDESIAVQNVIEGLKTGWLEVSEDMIFEAYGIKGKGTDLQIILENNGSYGVLAYVGGTTATMELHIDMDDFNPGTLPNGTNALGKGFYNDRIIAHEMVHAVMNDAMGALKTNSMDTWFKEGAAELIHGADERVEKVLATGITKGQLETRAQEFLTDGGAAWAGNDFDYAAAYIAAKYLENHLETAGAGDKSMKDIMTHIAANVGENDGDVAYRAAIAAATGGTYGAFTGAVNTTGFIDGSMNLDAGDELDTGSILGSDHDHDNVGGVSSAKNAEVVVDESTATDTTDNQPLEGFNVLWPDLSTSIAGYNATNADKLNFQLGANEKQTMELQLVDMRAKAILVDTVDISTKEKSEISLLKIDKSIQAVSDYRASLGAIQNRLEHSIKNIDLSAENLQSSESRIRDVDMASEMMKLSKNNILSQTSQFMLAQANQSSQGVLQLLR